MSIGAAVGGALGGLGKMAGSGESSQSQGTKDDQMTSNKTDISRPSEYGPSDVGFNAQIPIFQAAGQQAVNAFQTGDNNNQAQLAPLIQTSYGAMDSLMDSMGIARPVQGSYEQAQRLAYQSKYDLTNDPKTLTNNLMNAIQPWFAQDTAPGHGGMLYSSLLDANSPDKLAQVAQNNINFNRSFEPTQQNINNTDMSGFNAAGPDPWSAWKSPYTGGASTTPTSSTPNPNAGNPYGPKGFTGDFAGIGQGANKAVNFAGAGLNTGLGQPANSGFGAVPDQYQPTTTPFGLYLPGASQPGVGQGPTNNPYSPAQYVAPNQAQLAQMYADNGQHMGQVGPALLQEQQAVNDYNTAINMAKPNTDPMKMTNTANAAASVNALLANDPNYKFQMQQGLKAINAQAAASGANLSPAVAQQLSTYAQGQASSAMNTYRQQLSSIMNQGLQGVQMSQASTTGTAQGLAGSYTNTGNNVAGATANATGNWQVGPITQQSISNSQSTSQSQNSQSSGPSGMSKIGGVANAVGGFLGAL